MFWVYFPWPFHFQAIQQTLEQITILYSKPFCPQILTNSTFQKTQKYLHKQLKNTKRLLNFRSIASWLATIAY